MSTVSVNSPNPKPEIEQFAAHPEPKPRIWIAWSSFFFALLQSVCTFFAAVDGLRLIIGFGAFAFSGLAGTVIQGMHGTWLHEVMIALAFAGAMLNLVVLWQVRRLRNRPSAAWRVAPPSRKKLRMERLQFALSILTLILIGIEESLHFHWHSRL